MCMNNEGIYGKYIVQELHEPGHVTEAAKEMYNKFARRILYMDTNVVPGAFQMNTSWYFNSSPDEPGHGEHTHDFPEMLGFYGSDPDNPDDLGGEVEIYIEGERHLLTKTSMIYVPEGMKHLPMKISNVRRPIFHFSICMNPVYIDNLTAE